MGVRSATVLPPEKTDAKPSRPQWAPLAHGPVAVVPHACHFEWHDPVACGRARSLGFGV